MRAITYSRFGPAAEVLAEAEIDTPSPGPGEVLVRLKTSGVNPSDCRVRAGGRPGVTAPPWPRIVPHSDGAGVIEVAVGDNNCFGLDVTDRVLHRRRRLDPVVEQKAIVDADGTPADLASPAEKLHIH